MTLRIVCIDRPYGAAHFQLISTNGVIGEVLACLRKTEAGMACDLFDSMEADDYNGAVTYNTLASYKGCGLARGVTAFFAHVMPVHRRAILGATVEWEC